MTKLEILAKLERLAEIREETADLSDEDIRIITELEKEARLLLETETKLREVFDDLSDEEIGVLLDSACPDGRIREEDILKVYADRETPDGSNSGEKRTIRFILP